MEIDHWIKEINQVSKQIKELIAERNFEMLNWKASNKEWSVLQVLDHLKTVNSSYFPITENLRSGAYKPPFLGKIDFFVNLFGKLILKSVQPEEKKKTRTFPLWQPSFGEAASSDIDTFFDCQDELITWITKNADLIKENPVISSPASNNVVYRFQVVLDIIVAHEKRHLLQIKNTLDEAKSRKKYE
ncbi:MAG: DinB family protein [Cyclobacteriaceae bacterium]